jgi:transketolase
VLYPSDAVSTERLVALAAQTEGIVYIRTTRPKTAVLYDANETFVRGGSKVLRKSAEDTVTLVGAGITLHHALAAADQLAKEGVRARVIDLYSIKPLDVATLQQAARETKRVITIEDHSIEGGIGEAVCAAINGLAPVKMLAVTKIPRSGTPEQLMEDHGISPAAIVRAVQAG